MLKHTRTHSRRKSLYSVKNWSEYDKALVQRGWITFWLSGDFEQTWQYEGEKQRGAKFEYSEQAMVIMQTVKNVFHLPNRATEGLMRSIFAMLQIGLSVPDPTTLSRRRETLKVRLPKKASGDFGVVMD